MRINWPIVIGAAALALQSVATVGAVVAYSADGKAQVAALAESVQQISKTQDGTARKVDFLYERFVDAGFNKTFQGQ